MGNSNLFNSHKNHLKETIQANRYEIIIVKLHKGVDNPLKMHTGHFLMASKLRKLKGKKIIKINLLFVVYLENLHFSVHTI
jgi:hypothetical protein